MSKLSAALELAARGFKIFPIKAGAKFPPEIRHWPQEATDREEIVRRMWGTGNANIGIHCRGMAVIDVDPRKGGDASLAELDMFEGVPDTLTTRTPTGGRHLFYRLPEGHPGAPNSVGQLGKGLDIRSTGGYVVAPGSEVPAGRYVFELDVPIADAPEWLLLKVGTSLPTSGSPKAEVPDADETALARAAAWLASADPAIEGQGGDLHTFRTAARLRDYGVSAEQALDLLIGDWNIRCAPPWTAAELRQKVDNAYSYAQEAAAGKLALTDDDFAVPVHDPVEKVTPAALSGPKANHAPQRLQEFASGASGGPGYVVKGLLSAQSYAVVAGQPGAGKSFLMLDVAYHVAAGAPWHGRNVRQGLVLYLAYEGVGGMRKRAEALRRHYGQADVPLYVASAHFNIRESAGRKELAETIAALPAVPSLIIIDTLALALVGGDENSAQDVGAFNQGVKGLIDRTGACVVVIHHPPKSGEGLRGSSALKGAVDTEIEIADHMVRARKQRDYELGEPIAFSLKPIIVGVDEDGDEVTSCVVIEAKVRNEGAAAKLKGNTKRVFETLCELRPTNEPITQGELAEAAAEFTTKGRTAVSDAVKTLRRLGLIVTDKDKFITRRLE